MFLERQSALVLLGSDGYSGPALPGLQAGQDVRKREAKRREGRGMTYINTRFVAGLIYGGLDVAWVKGLADAPATAQGAGMPAGVIYKLSGRSVIKRVSRSSHRAVWAPGPCYEQFMKSVQKVHIPCDQSINHEGRETYSHSGDGKRVQSPSQKEGHDELEEVRTSKARHRSGRIENTRPPLTKASGAKVVCMDISAADSINRPPDLTEGTL